jgi:homeobox protein cut-like
MTEPMRLPPFISICRQKNEELEAQNLEQQQQMALLHCEVERLRADNVALYEKVRYLQSYSAQVNVQSDDLQSTSISNTLN